MLAAATIPGKVVEFIIQKAVTQIMRLSFYKRGKREMRFFEASNSHHRYGVILLINGVPVVQIEMKTLGVNPRRAM